jgi:hypothetical protein
MDVEDYAGMLERTGHVLVHLKGKERGLALGTKDWEKARNDWMRAHPQPKPPYVEDLVRTDSPRGRQLKLDKPAFLRVYDERDSAYLIALDEWRDSLNYLIAGHCLQVKLRRAGVEVTGAELRGQELRHLGLTPLQAAAIVSEVVSLSSLAKVDAVGFSDAPSDSLTSTDGAPSSQDHGSSLKGPDSQASD